MKGTAKGKQTTISTFFKLASLNKRNDRDKYVECFNFHDVFLRVGNTNLISSRHNL